MICHQNHSKVTCFIIFNIISYQPVTRARASLQTFCKKRFVHKEYNYRGPNYRGSSLNRKIQLPQDDSPPIYLNLCSSSMTLVKAWFIFGHMNIGQVHNWVNQIEPQDIGPTSWPRYCKLACGRLWDIKLTLLGYETRVMKPPSPRNLAAGFYGQL